MASGTKYLRLAILSIGHQTATIDITGPRADHGSADAIRQLGASSADSDAPYRYLGKSSASDCASWLQGHSGHATVWCHLRSWNLKFNRFASDV